MALCPGVTETNFFEAAQIQMPPMRSPQTPEEVVDTALRGLARGKSHIVSGWSNLLMIESERLVPRSFVARMAGRVLRPYFGDGNKEPHGTKDKKDTRDKQTRRSRQHGKQAVSNQRRKND